ncbi:MAG: AsmA family protein [Caulobacterales bacterium]
MKRGMVIGLSVAGGLLALLLISPFLIPASAFKPHIEKAVSDATGREFKINDGLRLTYWPVVGVDASGVTMTNAPGGKAPYMLKAKDVAIGVAVAPLFKGDIQVKKLVATEPQIALEANPGGKPNWVFEPKTPQKKKEAQNPEQVKNFGLGDVRIVDGTLSYADGKGPIREFSDIDMKVELESLDKPLKVDGELTMNAERLKAVFSAAQPRAFLNKGKTPLSVSLESAVLNAGVNGDMDTASGAITGAVKASGPSLRKLAAWTGSPMGEGPGLQAFDVSGDLSMKDKDVGLKKAAIKLDSVSGVGDLNINTAKDIPYITGALAFDALDLNVYMPTPEGVTVQQGWPKDPIDLSGLSAINADLALTTKTLLFQKYKIDSAKLNLNLAGGVMKAVLNELRLYGGKGSGVVTLDGSKKGYLVMAPKLSVTGLRAHGFLVDAIGLDKIEGIGNLNVDLKGQGANTDQLMRSLSGKADFKFMDGAVRGVNLAQIARSVKGALSGQAVGTTAKTDFAEMAASFALKNGVATTSDFRLLNPFIRVSGRGGLDVGQQTMNMRVEPKAVGTGKGQGGLYDMGGIGVPFLVTGPWAKLKFMPDLGDMLKSEATKQLDKLLGVNKGDGSTATGNSTKDALGGLLQGFGKKKN